MKKSFRALLSIAILCLYAGSWVGCSKTSSTTASSSSTTSDGAHDHDHDDHDHDDHDHDHEGHDHDHPEHGPHGGHMVELSGGSHAEWVITPDDEKITVYVEDAEKISKVEMKTTIADKETPYEFTKTELDGATVYELVSPELLTAVKMGEAVKTKLVLTTADGELLGTVKYHAH